jgi:hypothetical protein
MSMGGRRFWGGETSIFQNPRQNSTRFADAATVIAIFPGNPDMWMLIRLLRSGIM